MFSGKQQAVHLSMDNIITDDHFLQKTYETYERYVFNTRKQKARETVDDYISALCTLASTCNFCNCLKDSLLRDRIVLGIKDSSTRKQLLQEADLNLETCIAMCRAAEATSSSQPVKTETWTEDTTAVQAGSVSGNLSLSLRHRDPMASPEEVEMSEVNFKTELDDSDDSALQWTTEHQSSGFSRDRTEHKKLEPAWSMEEDSPDQPSAVYSTVQPMSDNTSGSLLSLNTSHECYFCSAAFALVSSLELHLASVHGETLHMVFPGPCTPDRCDASNYNTDMDKEVDNHGIRKMTTKKVNDRDTDDYDGKKKKRQPVCDVCGKSFCNSNNLKNHKLIHSGVKAFVCDVCGKSFTEAGSLTKHMRMHTGERPYKCPRCDRGFKQSGALQHHIKSVHEGVRPHLCDVCGATFSENRKLTVHKRIHTGEKPHVCSDCGNGFISRLNLKRHYLTHTKEKPHVCSDCGKRYSHACNLSQHRLTHSKEKRHVCSVCGKGFIRTRHLIQHRLTHTGEKPYVCPDCGKGFTQSGNLANHRLMHTGQKPHSCPHCPSTFRLKQGMKKHVQRKHQ